MPNFDLAKWENERDDRAEEFTPRPGWLRRQIEELEREVKTWPEWMKREAE